jgi:hypothetical protein
MNLLRAEIKAWVLRLVTTSVWTALVEMQTNKAM